MFPFEAAPTAGCPRVRLPKLLMTPPNSVATPDTLPLFPLAEPPLSNSIAPKSSSPSSFTPVEAAFEPSIAWSTAS